MAGNSSARRRRILTCLLPVACCAAVAAQSGSPQPVFIRFEDARPGLQWLANFLPDELRGKDANALVLQLLPKYEHVFELENGNLGLSFDEVYNMQRIEPLDFWQKMYEEVRTELKDMGLKL